MTSTYDLIETTTLTSAASSVTFSSITQDFRDLVLVVELERDGTAVANSLARINNDSSNYSHVSMLGTTRFDGATISRSGTASSLLFADVGNNGSGKHFIIVHFLDYSATDKHKTILSRGSENGIESTNSFANRYASTNAVTEIDFFSVQDPYSAGSSFSLYGISA